MKRRPPRRIRFLQNHARKLLRISEKALAKSLLEDDEQLAKLERRSARVQRILADDYEEITEEQFDRTLRKLEKVLIVNAVWSPKSYFREIAEAFVVAAVIALFVRSFLAEPFKIPTGSMIPTLEINDFIFVTKYNFGLRLPLTQSRVISGGVPSPGDVVVFDFPGEGEDKGKNFIKRVVAVPGDRVAIKGNQIYRGGKPIPRTLLKTKVPCSDGDGGVTPCLCEIYEEQLGTTLYFAQHHSAEQQNPLCHNTSEWPLHRPRAESRLDFAPITFSHGAPEVIVPEGKYLVMGDNRDNSHDGRYWGFVPFEALKGRAWIIWLARDKSRIFSSVHKSTHDGDVAHAATKRTHTP